jgi:hypothetical protein
MSTGILDNSILPRANLSVIAKLIHRVAGHYADGVTPVMDDFVSRSR